MRPAHGGGPAPFMNQNDSQHLVHRAVQWALSKKAEDVRVMDLRGLLDVTDWFVLATGFSEVQVQAIGDAITDGAHAEGLDVSHVEGREAGRWMLVDFIDVVVHVMLPEERDRYRLDRLWGDSALYAYDESGASRLVRERVVDDVGRAPEHDDDAEFEALERAFDDPPSIEEE